MTTEKKNQKNGVGQTPQNKKGREGREGGIQSSGAEKKITSNTPSRIGFTNNQTPKNKERTGGTKHPKQKKKKRRKRKNKNPEGITKTGRGETKKGKKRYSGNPITCHQRKWNEQKLSQKKGEKDGK